MVGMASTRTIQQLPPRNQFHVGKIVRCHQDKNSTPKNRCHLYGRRHGNMNNIFPPIMQEAQQGQQKLKVSHVTPKLKDTNMHTKKAPQPRKSKGIWASRPQEAQHSNPQPPNEGTTNGDIRWRTASKQQLCKKKHQLRKHHCQDDKEYLRPRNNTTTSSPNKNSVKYRLSHIDLHSFSMH